MKFFFSVWDKRRSFLLFSRLHHWQPPYGTTRRSSPMRHRNPANRLIIIPYGRGSLMRIPKNTTIDGRRSHDTYSILYILSILSCLLCLSIIHYIFYEQCSVNLEKAKGNCTNVSKVTNILKFFITMLHNLIVNGDLIPLAFVYLFHQSPFTSPLTPLLHCQQI